MNRRTFLRTAGGTAVACPLLGSLLPASAASAAAPLRFVAMGTPHGGIWGEHMWPSDDLLTEQRDVGHTIRRGDLASSLTGQDRVLSDVLTAHRDRLTPGLVAQMNLIRGLDIPFYIAHHTGGYLGNYGRNDGEFETDDPLPYLPTIDQVMAWSDVFYADLAGVVDRSLHLMLPMSWGWENPEAPGGDVDEMPTRWSVHEVFDRFFDTGPQGEDRRLVVDKVLESYRRLRDGAFGDGRRLSAGDRQRLDAHMERLYEVERRLSTIVDCGDPVRPPQDTQGHPGEDPGSFNLSATAEYYGLWNELLAMALICGTTRIATLNSWHTFEPYPGDWHQEVAHEAWVSEAAEQRLVLGNQRFFDQVFCDLCARLDVPDSDGNTVLHNSLLTWVQESGPLTHEATSLPVITAGSARGALRTGQYLDYRNRQNLSVSDGEPNPIHHAQRPGLLYGHWLADCLDLCGVQRSEWRIANNPGYGLHNNQNRSAWPAYVEALADDPLPFLTP